MMDVYVHACVWWGEIKGFKAKVQEEIPASMCIALVLSVKLV